MGENDRGAKNSHKTNKRMPIHLEGKSVPRACADKQNRHREHVRHNLVLPHQLCHLRP